MKKIFLLGLILFIFLIYKNTSIQTNTKDYLNYNDFIKNIYLIKSFKIENTNKYYQEYLNQEFKNYIHLINKVNHPNFLDINEHYSSSAITYPVLLVNKKFKLSNEYIPKNLANIQIDYIKRDYDIFIDNNLNINLINFFNDYNLNFTIFSAYRPYKKQEELYISSTDNLVAKPGESEHQSGLAIDISKRSIGLTYLLANDIDYSLLYNNLYKYGFILRYPKNKESITGFKYEPWHFRYVGTKIAEIIFLENITLEEYFYYYVPLIY